MIGGLVPRRRLGWLWVVLTGASIVNAVRLRQRLSGLHRLHRLDTVDGRSSLPDDDDFLVVHRPGVHVDAATRRDAVAYANQEGLDVLDLVPGDLPAGQALDLGRRVDTTTFRAAPFAPGRALHAVVVRGCVWERARPGDRLTGGSYEMPDQAAFLRLMETLKQHAPRSMDLVVAPRLQATEVSLGDLHGEMQVVYDSLLPLALACAAARSAALAAGLLICPAWGMAAGAAFLFEPRLVTGPTLPESSSSTMGHLRSWAQPFLLIRLARAAHRRDRRSGADPIESRRPIYAELMAGGTDKFFAPRRTTCPLCHGTRLEQRLRSRDWFQFKPGQFVLEGCEECGHLFQNPRLSDAGLAFYYRDAYDGLGARSLAWSTHSPVPRTFTGPGWTWCSATSSRSRGSTSGAATAISA